MRAVNSTDVSKKLGKTITITSSTGGAGATTLSILVGSALSETIIKDETKGEERLAKSIVVDLDTRDGNVIFFTGHFKPTPTGDLKPTILEYTRQYEKDSSSADIFSSVIEQNDGKPDLMLAPRGGSSANDFSSEFYADVVRKLQGHYDFIILNPCTSNYDVIKTEVAYKLPDKIFYILNISVPAVLACDKWLRDNVGQNSSNKDLPIDRSVVSIVLNNNRSDTSDTVSPSVENTIKSIDTLTARISYSERFYNSINTQSIEEALKDENLADELTPVLEEIFAL